MTTSLQSLIDELDAIVTIECGTVVAKKQFAIAEGYRNLNHGSFGTYPTAVRTFLRYFQDESEALPDIFIRYDYPRLLDEARHSLAALVNAPPQTCVFVQNASVAFNTILRNLVYQPGDVIIHFSTIYGACEKTIEYMKETTHVESYKIQYGYPISDADLLTAFVDAVKSIRSEGKNPRLAVFDTIVSSPGVRMPFEELTRLCREHGVLSCIDAAHCVGQIPIDLTALDPDFWWSNCHKWLYTPRGSCVLYVPKRNQPLMRSTLPTSHSFTPLPKEGAAPIHNPLGPNPKDPYSSSFEFVGTQDSSPYLCLPAAVQWRQKLTWKGWRGEDAVISYNIHLAGEAGRIVSTALGTEVMDNAEKTLTQCAFSNVRLPLDMAEIMGGDTGLGSVIAIWMSKYMADNNNTFLMTFPHNGHWWVRLSAQIYLNEEDFEWAAKVLINVCELVKKGEWKKK